MIVEHGSVGFVFLVSSSSGVSADNIAGIWNRAFLLSLRLLDKYIRAEKEPIVDEVLLQGVALGGIGQSALEEKDKLGLVEPDVRGEFSGMLDTLT